MGDKTAISWTDATWNPVRGCSRVSAGCMNCYAEKVAARFSGPGMPYEGLVRMRQRNPGADPKPIGWSGVVRMVPEHLADPLRWKKPRRIFVNSMSDLFHENLSNEQIAAVFGVMAAAPQHTFQVLTKRAKRMREWFEWVASTFGDAPGGDGEVRSCIAALDLMHIPRSHVEYQRWPLPNVWIGVSVENQEAADERIPDLLMTPAALRFLSCEPLLGGVDVLAYLNAFSDSSVDWVIAGCESGPGARSCEVDWLRWLRGQCRQADVAFFLKQARGPERNGIGGTRHIISIESLMFDPSGGAVTLGVGSKRKAGGVIELPYLDGVQHAAFPGGV